jgi:1-acyl-sn-glycerol-3-phosphate acyltransferase
MERSVGVDYDTDWARRPPARFGRAAVQDLIGTPLVRAVTSPTVHGLDRIAHLDEPVIFAANHASHLDAPLLLSVVPDRWRRQIFVAGAADYFFDTKTKAAVSSFLLNAVPVDRVRVSRDSANRLAALLSGGWSMLIFPEGGRSPDGWGQSHQRGAAWLAVRTGHTIVPIHIEGTRQILAKGSKTFRPGRTSVTFGPPLHPGGDARALTAELEASIAALADELTTDWYTARRRAAAGATPSLTGPDVAAWRRTWALGPASRPRHPKRRNRGGPDHWPDM